jgi:oxygen-independent coproporphyrinogen-3 oxidase
VYCDFYSTVGTSSLFDDYIDAIFLEFDYFQERYPFSYSTIYLGGGTPSLLPETGLARLFNKLSQKKILETCEEITLEVNPEDVTLEKIKSWKDVGINRISLGVQSFVERELRWLRRNHTVEQNLKALEWLEKYFNNISIDFILHIPGSTKKDIDYNLSFLDKFSITHVSMYGLTVEQGTSLFAKWKHGEFLELNEEEQRKQWLYAYDKLSRKGFEQYEISNWAKNKMYSRHNFAYWVGDPYIGLGPSAHSYVHPLRWANKSHLLKYIELVKQGSKWFEEEYITPEKTWMEMLMLRLRTVSGIQKKEVEEKLGLVFFERLVKIIEKNNLKAYFNEKEDSISLTLNGFLIFDHLLSKIIAEKF